ncbi:MAG: hypothetical protein HY363_05170 [Candidatus Aenigmarchaeota archaeon]|nr:hypothetical protein [Candidatus Aenigmarchaeota archaeon]
MNSFFPEDRLDILARKFHIGPYALASDVEKKNTDYGSFRQEGDDFVFNNLPGIKGEVKLLGTLADGGCEKLQSDWFEYSKINTEGVVVPNSRVLYQIMRQLYHSRNCTELQKVVASCVNFFRTNYDASKWRHTGSKVLYKTGLEATIQHLQHDGSIQATDLDIPEFTRANDAWSYFVLAPEQLESALGKTNPVQQNAKQVLEELLGEGYEEAGAVFQYVSSRKNNNLREVYLWTPTTTNRNAERAVVLGVIINDRFSIMASAVGPLSGWSTSAQKKFHRK